MKYKLINRTTNQETICDKVTIDGFDYYVSEEEPKIDGEKCYSMYTKELVFFKLPHTIQCKKVIATTKPNIDIPKVVDEVEKVLTLLCKQKADVNNTIDLNAYGIGVLAGYNKSQETHPFSEKDVREIFEVAQTQKNYGDYKSYTFEEAIRLWKEQQTKIVYYEKSNN